MNIVQNVETFYKYDKYKYNYTPPHANNKDKPDETARATTPNLWQTPKKQKDVQQQSCLRRKFERKWWKRKS